MIDQTTPELTCWDARAEIAVGQFILRHLAASPPPDESAFADDLRRYSDRLLQNGQVHLAALGTAGLVALSLVS